MQDGMVAVHDLKLPNDQAAISGPDISSLIIPSWSCALKILCTVVFPVLEYLAQLLPFYYLRYRLWLATRSMSFTVFEDLVRYLMV